MENKNKWKRQPQEREGDYFFNGRAICTRKIGYTLPYEEIKEIIIDLMQFVEEKNGIDYLQVYVDESGRKIFCIDQLSKSMLEGDGYTDEEKIEYNHWTMLFSEEY
jgi:hypothetical protein